MLISVFNDTHQDRSDRDNNFQELHPTVTTNDSNLIECQAFITFVKRICCSFPPQYHRQMELFSYQHLSTHVYRIHLSTNEGFR